MTIALPPIEIALEEETPARDLQSVLNGLLSYNRALEPESHYTKFAVFARDHKGGLRGGLTGALYFNALFIEYLWLDAPLRGQGVGRALMRCAEREALARGRDLVHLESMSFQAPGFYKSLGYVEYGRLEGYSDGAARVHFTRRLPSPDVAEIAADRVVQRLHMHLEVTSEPAEADVRAVRDGVMAYNAQVYQPDAVRPLNVLVRGPGGQVLGGLSGSSYWNASFVDLFWLDYGLRRQGRGSAILRLAEREAVARGCAFMHLDTFDFQARGFYEKNGYHVYGTVVGFTGRVERYHMVKQLVSAPPSDVALREFGIVRA